MSNTMSESSTPSKVLTIEQLDQLLSIRSPCSSIFAPALTEKEIETICEISKKIDKEE